MNNLKYKTTEDYEIKRLRCRIAATYNQDQWRERIAAFATKVAGLKIVGKPSING